MRMKAKGFGLPPFYLPPSPFDLYYGFALVKGKIALLPSAFPL